MGKVITKKDEGYSICRDDDGAHYGNTLQRDFVTEIVKPGVWTVDGESLEFPDGVYSLDGNTIIVYEGQAYVESDFVIPYMTLFEEKRWVKLEWQC